MHMLFFKKVLIILRFLVGCTVPLNGEEVVQQNTETESASFFALSGTNLFAPDMIWLTYSSFRFA